LRQTAPIVDAVPETRRLRTPHDALGGAIELRNVTFRYPGGPVVLDDVAFEVRPGEMVALSGRSGAGKSTVLRLLLGFEEPQAGSVLYDGRDLADLDPGSVRRQTGAVLQSARPVAGSLFRNVAGGRPITQDQAWEALREAGLFDFVHGLPMGLETIVGEDGAGLSGGQVQRLLIARALVSQPRVLFLDEATSALDNRTQAEVAEAISAQQVTRVVIAHRLSTIRKADRIFVFDAGRIVQSGSYDDLAEAPGEFRDLVDRQRL
jgi:ATP-binding cassette subfamily C protein